MAFEDLEEGIAGLFADLAVPIDGLSDGFRFFQSKARDCLTSEHAEAERAWNRESYHRRKPASVKTRVGVTHAGRTQTIAAWARETGIKDTTIRQRLLLGWTLERALTVGASTDSTSKSEAA